MNTLTTSNIVTQAAQSPFHFNSAAYLLRIERERASNLGELLEAMRTCPEDSIFQHTFRTLQEHHFIREGYSNDFAHWAYIACNEVGLAERLASVDIRSFTSVADLRTRIVQIVEEYLHRGPRLRERPALKPFYFCSSETVVMPTPFVAHNLEKFINALEQVSVHSVHHHFIEARLRLKLRTNDFSQWLDKEMNLKQEAHRLNGIDIYTSTLEGVRDQILRILQSAVN
jgi:uncharacterized protein DUF5752